MPSLLCSYLASCAGFPSFFVSPCLLWLPGPLFLPEWFPLLTYIYICMISYMLTYNSYAFLVSCAFLVFYVSFVIVCVIVLVFYAYLWPPVFALFPVCLLGLLCAFLVSPHVLLVVAAWTPMPMSGLLYAYLVS